MGLDETQISSVLRNKIRGDVATRFREEDRQIDILVQAEDRGGLSRALRSVVADSDLRRRLGTSAHAHVARTFTVERFVREYSELYARLAHR